MINSLYDNFKHWSSTGSVYILSDTHFNDADCALMDKGWITPEEQVAAINKKARKTDTLILLGDVGDVSYVRQLKAGHKVLIMGNHDESATKFKDVFDEIYTGALFIGDKLLLSHEPIQGLDFCVNIHGHDHNPKNKGDLYHLNLAANVCGYIPVSLGELIKKGLISKIKTIHRETIDKANNRKGFYEEKN